MLDVTIYNLDGEVTHRYDVEEGEGVDYVSLVAPTTYGPPALVAPTRGRDEPRAIAGERVLYINTGLVPAWEIERVND